MKSAIFHTDAYKILEQKTLDLLISQGNFLSARTIDSPRAIGDAVQSILTDSFHSILGHLSAEYSVSFARRAMADLAFTGMDGIYYVVDIKTHRTDTQFNMPNLISVERLSRFYEDDTNYFSLLIVSYHIFDGKVVFTEVKFAPIEFLAWTCLSVGALGWGQIQIANANRITLHYPYSRKKWMLELCDVMLEFYPREINKIAERIKHFQNVRDFWLARPDDEPLSCD